MRILILAIVLFLCLGCERYSLEERKLIETQSFSEQKFYEFYEEGDISVNRALVLNPNTPSLIIESIYKKGPFFLEREMAKNPKTPYWILYEIFKNHNYLDEEFLENPSVSSGMLSLIASKNIQDWKFLEKVIQHPSVTNKLLLRIFNAHYQNGVIQHKVLTHPKLTAEDLIKLSRSGVSCVCMQYIIGHPNMPKDLIVELSYSEDPTIITKALSVLGTFYTDPEGQKRLSKAWEKVRASWYKPKKLPDKTGEEIAVSSP